MEEQLLENLRALRELENKYFQKFNQFYPTFVSKEQEGVFGPSELYEMAIEAQVLLASLGQTAVKRLNYVGFDLLFPFSNPVDWYNWKIMIKEKDISHTIYFSISTRVATEFQRIEMHLERKIWESYCQLSEAEFSVPKDRYSSVFSTENSHDQECDDTTSNDQAAVNHTHININNLAYNDKTETDAVDNLDKLNKSSGIWSNVANVASTVMKLSGLKI
ncbi:hypothetical protein ABVD55_005160 [Vibrio harveyi]